VTPEQERDFTAFVRAQGNALARYARLLFADAGAAEDALQTALLRVANNWPKGVDVPVAYARTALRNLALDEGRRRHLVPVPSDDQPATAPAPDIADALVAAHVLDRVLSALPPRQRMTVVLRVIDGLSEAETAQAMRCSPGTVKSNLARGLARLRTELDTAPAAERTCT
jgi:RNA polymerase sigma-70 factor (sigma-E family)